MFYQQYINSYNKLNLPETMIWHIFQKFCLIQDNFMFMCEQYQKGSNKVVLEMNEDTTKYKVIRA